MIFGMFQQRRIKTHRVRYRQTQTKKTAKKTSTENQHRKPADTNPTNPTQCAAYCLHWNALYADIMNSSQRCASLITLLPSTTYHILPHHILPYHILPYLTIYLYILVYLGIILCLFATSQGVWRLRQVELPHFQDAYKLGINTVQRVPYMSVCHTAPTLSPKHPNEELSKASRNIQSFFSKVFSLAKRTFDSIHLAQANSLDQAACLWYVGTFLSRLNRTHNLNEEVLQR